MSNEKKIEDYLKISPYNVGFPASIPRICKLTIKDFNSAITNLIEKGVVQEILIPHDFKGNTHYEQLTTDLSMNSVKMEGKVIDEDHFEELDSLQFEMITAYQLI